MRNGSRFAFVSDAAFRSAVAPGGAGLDALAKASGTTPDRVAVRAAFVAEVSKVEGEGIAERALDVVISTEGADRERDVIAVDGWDLRNYRRNPVVLFAHDYYSLPIARGENVRAEDGKLKARAVFVPGEMYAFAETVYRMMAGGWMSAASVGFLPKAWTYNEERRGVDYTEQELLEFSVVPVPANAECLVEARAAGVDVEPLKAWAERTLRWLGASAPRVRVSARSRQSSRLRQAADEGGLDVPGVILLLADMASDVSEIAPLLSGSNPARLYEAVGRLVDLDDDVHEAKDALLDAAEDAEEPEEEEPSGGGGMEPYRSARQRRGGGSTLLKGVSPKDASTAKAPEDTAWSAPALSDFTSDNWGDLTSTEKRHIAGHYAWASMMPPDAFGDLKLPHHRPSDAAIVWRGVAAAAARLSPAQIPDNDMSAVKAHLARHYRAFDKTPPWEANASAWSRLCAKAATLAAPELGAALRAAGFVDEAAALDEVEAVPARSAPRVAVLVEDVFDLAAVPYEAGEPDVLSDLTAEQVLAALREGIGAQAELGVRRALKGALGRID